MEIGITCVLKILCFPSRFRLFEMKNFHRRPTEVSNKISQLVDPLPSTNLLIYTGQFRDDFS